MKHRFPSRLPLLIVLMTGSVLQEWALAEAYTNKVGVVINGEVTGSTNGLVSIRSNQRMIRTFSLKTFSAEEQERLLLAAGAPLPLPADLAQRLDYLRDLSIRAERMEQAGRQNPEETRKRQEQLQAMWQRGVNDARAQGRISAALHDQWINVLGSSAAAVVGP